MKTISQPIGIKTKFEADRIMTLVRLWPVWACLVAIALGIRRYFAWAYFGNYDQTSYEIVAGIMNRGGNIYAETTRYNYTPIWAGCLFLFSKIAR